MNGSWLALGTAAALSAAAALRSGSRRRGDGNVDAAEQLGYNAYGTRQDFAEFYPESAAGTLEESYGYERHCGRGICWLGVPGELVPIEARYAIPMDGNIFDWRKLGSVAAEVRERPDRVVMDAPYGHVGLVDRTSIEESIQYADYDMGSPYSTGDDELDAYLADPDAYDQGEVRDFERRLRRAERDGDGDFGALWFQVRNGNHRTFGAINGGESVVWLKLQEDQLQRLRGDRETKGVQQLYRAIRAAQKRHGGKMLSRPRRRRVRITPQLKRAEERYRWLREREAELARLLLDVFASENRDYAHVPRERLMERPGLYWRQVVADMINRRGFAWMMDRVWKHPHAVERRAVSQQRQRLHGPLYDMREAAGLDPRTGERPR